MADSSTGTTALASSGVGVTCSRSSPSPVLAGRLLELGQGPLDDVAGLLGRSLDHGAQRDHERGRLGRGEAHRPREVVGVVDPDDAIALERLQVDLDEVTGEAR